MENVLNCKLVEVEGRIYRVQGGPLIAPYTAEDELLLNGETSNSELVPKYDMSQMNELSNDDYDESLIFQQDENTYYTTISLDNQLYGHIIGKGGQLKKKIELESGATIIIPNLNDNNSKEIMIKGKIKLKNILIFDFN